MHPMPIVDLAVKILLLLLLIGFVRSERDARAAR